MVIFYSQKEGAIIEMGHLQPPSQSCYTLDKKFSNETLCIEFYLFLDLPIKIPGQANEYWTILVLECSLYLGQRNFFQLIPHKACPHV
jgi:hypothetical protein